VIAEKALSQELVEKGVFKPIGGGRSTRYDVVL